MARFLSLCGLTLLLAACSNANAPASSSPASSSSGENEAPPEEEPTTSTPATYGDPQVAFTKAEVQKLFDSKCVLCHSDGKNVFDLDGDFTKTTVGVAVAGGRAECADSATQTRIVPGDREASLLWQKVNGTQDCGDAMPPPTKGKKLSATELERLGLFIDAL